MAAPNPDNTNFDQRDSVDEPIEFWAVVRLAGIRDRLLFIFLYSCCFLIWIAFLSVIGFLFEGTDDLPFNIAFSIVAVSFLITVFAFGFLVIAIKLTASKIIASSGANGDKSATSSRVARQSRKTDGHIDDPNNVIVISDFQGNQKGSDMDLTTYIGLAGSIASIISFLEDRISPKQISVGKLVAHFETRAQRKGTAESHLVGRISGDELLTVANEVFDFYRTDAKFLERINKRCIAPYYEAIEDYGLSETDVGEKRDQARRCVCRNISLAKKDNNGSYPSEEFKSLWEKFECEML